MINIQRGGLRKAMYCFFVIAFVIGETGCGAVKGKFVRKRRPSSMDDEVIPVLMPVDYPEAVETRAGTYQQHFNLFKVWYQDLMVGLEDRASDKQILYGLAQLRLHLEAMTVIVTGEASEKAMAVRQELDAIEALYGQAKAFRHDAAVRRRLERLGDMVWAGLKPGDVSGSLIE